MTDKEKFKSREYQETFQSLVKHPLIKLALFGGAVVGLIMISGIVMKVVATTVDSYKDLKAAIAK